MTFAQELAALEKGSPEKAYLLYGDEPYLAELFLKRLEGAILPSGDDGLNLTRFNDDNGGLGAALQAAQTPPFLAARRLVIYQGQALASARSGRGREESGEEGEEAPEASESRRPTAVEAALERYLAAPLESTVLALWVRGSVDRRKKFFRLASQVGRVIECQPLRGRELVNWVQQEVRSRQKIIGEEAATMLISFAGAALTGLAQEIEKLCLYAGPTREITTADVQAVVRRGGEARIFDLLDRLGEGETTAALAVLRELLRLGEPPARILFMLARQVRLLLLTRLLLAEGLLPELLAERLSLHPFAAKKLAVQSRVFQEKELEKALEELLEADLALKEGRQPPDLLLETVVLRLSAPSAGKGSS